jgi:hypothetical protein
MTKYNSAPTPKNLKKKSKQPSIYRWLRERTSPIDFGVKYQGHPIHCNFNEAVISAYAGGHWLSRMTNNRFDQHFSGKETFYFTGASSNKFPETLVNIDIDCHNFGTLKGAIEFAMYLKANVFPNLYFEISTNGHGIHGYILIRKDGLAPEVLNSLLARLQADLRKKLSDGKFDVETVEIKGTCPVFQWGQRKGELLGYRSGQLAKLPRDSRRFEELKKTTVLTSIDLFRLPVFEKKLSNQKLAATDHPVSGSITGKLISADEVSELDGQYKTISTLLLEKQKLSAGNRVVVDAEDVAIFLMLLKFFTQNMNADGSLPQLRFKKLWTSLFETGDIDRSFDDKRFACVRNYLSSLNLIDWDDNTYVVGVTDSQGKRSGKACKWKASELLMSWLEPTNFQSESSVQSGVNEDLVDSTYQLEERETSLAGTSISEDMQKLVRTPDSKTIKPEQIVAFELSRLSADDIAHLTAPFDVQMGLVA